MADKPYDVVAIGNAIVDIISRCDDEFLERHELAKGHMQLVDANTVARLYADAGPSIEISGGSAANTVVGVAGFGGRAGYIGKVADDEFGRIFSHDLKAAGVSFETKPAPAAGDPTARSLVLVTPDGERTMNTFLGVSPQLETADLDPELIASAAILYLEGYLFDRPQAQEAFRAAAAIAKRAGTKTSLTLSDGFCVDRHRDAFLALIKSDVDILFANESEMLSLTGASDFDSAVAALEPDVPVLAATRSEQGSVLVAGGQRVVVSAEPVESVIDTTGAGDLYAAGVLLGLSRNLDLNTCGKLGSIAAAEIISHIGARPEKTLSTLASAAGLEI